MVQVIAGVNEQLDHHSWPLNKQFNFIFIWISCPCYIVFENLEVVGSDPAIVPISEFCHLITWIQQVLNSENRINRQLPRAEIRNFTAIKTPFITSTELTFIGGDVILLVSIQNPHQSQER